MSNAEALVFGMFFVALGLGVGLSRIADAITDVGVRLANIHVNNNTTVRYEAAEKEVAS